MAQTKLQLNAPFTRESLVSLRAGDKVALSGVIYTARDAAHKRLVEELEQGGTLPFDLEGACIYYVGPTPAAPGQVIGSAGPTTSYRMDAYTIPLLEQGLLAMIGKGKRSPEVRAALQEAGAVYFAAVGGAGALLATCIKEAEVVAYADLGAEAIRRLRVEDLPLVVVLDSLGQNLYELGPQAYLADLAQSGRN